MVEAKTDEAGSLRKYVPISRRKIARLGDICKGVKVEEAKYRLTFFPQRAAREVLEAIKTAESSYIQKFPNADIDALIVKSVIVDKGPTIKRLIYRARGSADRIQKRSAHVRVVVGVKNSKRNSK